VCDADQSLIIFIRHTLYMISNNIHIITNIYISNCKREVSTHSQMDYLVGLFLLFNMILSTQSEMMSFLTVWKGHQLNNNMMFPSNDLVEYCFMIISQILELIPVICEIIMKTIIPHHCK